MCSYVASLVGCTTEKPVIKVSVFPPSRRSTEVFLEIGESECSICSQNQLVTQHGETWNMETNQISNWQEKTNNFIQIVAFKINPSWAPPLHIKFWQFTDNFCTNQHWQFSLFLHTQQEFVTITRAFITGNTYSGWVVGLEQPRGAEGVFLQWQWKDGEFCELISAFHVTNYFHYSGKESHDWSWTASSPYAQHCLLSSHIPSHSIMQNLGRWTNPILCRIFTKNITIWVKVKCSK